MSCEVDLRNDSVALLEPGDTGADLLHEASGILAQDEGVS